MEKKNEKAQRERTSTTSSHGAYPPGARHSLKSAAAHNRPRFKSRTQRAAAAKLERLKKDWSKRVRIAAIMIAALMQLSSAPALDTLMASRLQMYQARATEIHRRLSKGGRGVLVVKKKHKPK